MCEWHLPASVQTEHWGTGRIGTMYIIWKFRRQWETFRVISLHSLYGNPSLQIFSTIPISVLCTRLHLPTPLKGWQTSIAHHLILILCKVAATQSGTVLVVGVPSTVDLLSTHALIVSLKTESLSFSLSHSLSFSLSLSLCLSFSFIHFLPHIFPLIFFHSPRVPITFTNFLCLSITITNNSSANSPPSQYTYSWTH